MEFNAQIINEALAKGEQYFNDDIKKEIENADDFLKLKKEIAPSWIENFFSVNENKMRETISRSLTEKGLESLKGYREGYFNEIIQNGNDLGSAEKITIEVSEKNGKYIINCEYVDNGFSISNVYSFLNREMSDKSSEKGQSGKFGIGIKSFFSFVDEFTIESNVIMSFKIERESEIINFQNDNGDIVDKEIVNSKIKSEVILNKEWNKQDTRLTVTFDKNVKSSFNINKLTNLIQYLIDENSNENLLDYFYCNDDEKVIFDIRSLLFTDVASKKDRSIKNIIFKGKDKNTVLTCCESKNEEILYLNSQNKNKYLWEVKKYILTISSEENEEFKEEYLLFSKKDVCIAYLLNTEVCENNRHYATYYIKQSSDHSLVPTNALIHTNYSNMHRTDLGHSEKEIVEVTEFIKKQLKDLYKFMCSKEVGEHQLNAEISDVLHNILFQYKDIDIETTIENPFNIYELTTKYLPKIKNMKENKPIVLKREEKEKFERCSYVEGQIEDELKKAYNIFLDKNEVMTYSELISNEQCISGVKRIYQYLFDKSMDNNNKHYLFNILNAFDGIDHLIKYRVIGSPNKIEDKIEDTLIDEWLNNCEIYDESNYNELMLLKIIGRYEISDAIEYDGSINKNKVGFKSYLFNRKECKSIGPLSKKQNEQYQEIYGSLRNELLQLRVIDNGNQKDKYKVRCIGAEGTSARKWDYTWDYYPELEFQNYYISNKNLMLFIGKLISDVELNEYLNLINNNVVLCENSTMKFKYRDNIFEHIFIKEQQIINLNFLRYIKVKTFEDFKFYRDAFDKINSGYFNKYNVECRIEGICSSELCENVFPWFYRLAYDISHCFNIESLNVNTRNECDEKTVDFIEKITGKKVYLYRFISQSKKHVIGYIGNKKIKLDRFYDENFHKEDKFFEIGNSNITNDIHIFYDNITDKHKIINSVLKDIGDIADEILMLFDGYIYNGNNNTLSYTEYSKFIAKKNNEIYWRWQKIDNVDLTNNTSYKNLYKLLTARGCYDIFCPICNEIPHSEIGGKDKNINDRRIVIFENENEKLYEKHPYIITIACNYCFERLKKTLSHSNLVEENGEWYLDITTQSAHGLHEKNICKQKIELAPINIAIIKKMKLDRK